MRIRRNPFDHRSINKRWQRFLKAKRWEESDFGEVNESRFKTEAHMQLAVDAYLRGWNDRTNKNIQDDYEIHMKYHKTEPDWITSEMKKGFVK